MWVFTVAGLLFMAYGRYRQAKQQGVWRWGFFFALLGAMGLFFGLVIVPLTRSSWMESHPDLFFAVTLGAILLFVMASLVVARRVSKDWLVKGSQEP